jgi:phosphoglucosamine mutase
MISASHNSFEDNGIKFFDSKGDKLSHSVEEEIEKIYFNDELIAEAQKRGTAIGKAKRIDDVVGRYIVQLKNSFPRDISLKNMRIVLDTANGAGYIVGPTVLEELGADVVVLHNKPDGFNINDNCGALHVKDLCETVVKYRADIGIALDGDADRVVIVDENGVVVDGDQLLGALGAYMNSTGKLKGGAIVSTVMSNQGLEEFLASEKIKLFRSAVGDKNVLEIMKKEGVNFGGEQSGHVIVSDFAKTGDGLVSALQILALLIKTQQKASKALRPFELYPHKLTHLMGQQTKPRESIKGLDEKLKMLDENGVIHLIRYSGTENKLRILLECKDVKKLTAFSDEMADFFTKELN